MMIAVETLAGMNAELSAKLRARDMLVADVKRAVSAASLPGYNGR